MYEPSSSPFEMPVGQVCARLVLARPLRLPPREGATLDTTLRGTFERALLEAGCAMRPHRTSSCAVAGAGRPICQSPHECPLPRLLRPRSEHQGRDHPTAAWVAASPQTDAALDATVTLWGRTAVDAEAVARGALTVAGRAGLRDPEGLVPFEVEVRHRHMASLGEWVRGTLPGAGGGAAAEEAASGGRILLELAGPADVKDDLARVIGSFAHDLVQWDLMDRGLDRELRKAGCDLLAEAARDAARAAMSRISVESGLLVPEDIGLRRSRSNRGAFHLGGLRGHLVLAGDLRDALPWLAALQLRGLGEKKSFGLGRVRLWAPLTATPAS